MTYGQYMTTGHYCQEENQFLTKFTLNKGLRTVGAEATHSFYEKYVENSSARGDVAIPSV